MKVFLVFLLLVAVDAKCIWYGIGDDSVPGHPRYKSYNGTGQPLNDAEAFKTLSKLCPTYADTPESPLCCDKNQVKFFSDSARAAYELLHRCPACWANFRLLFCGMTCDPNHSEFLISNVVGDLVESIQYSVTELVANTFFNSCKDVQFAGSHAIDPICGSTSCTPELLLKGLGGDQSPFPVTFQIISSNDSSTNAFNASFYPCNVSVPRVHSDPGGPSCVCMDCESACAASPVPPTEKPWPTIFGIDACWVISFFILMLLVLAFCTFEFSNHIYRKRGCSYHFGPKRDGTDVPESEVEQPGCLGRLQAKLEVHMCRAFSLLGRSVARHPYITLVLSIVMSVALSAGLAFFTVTTNPVELWSGPNSRSRLEKNHFDNTFMPFYRTEQLIIRPTNQSFFLHNKMFPASGTAYFGPALEKDFLFQILHLQNELRNTVVYSPEFGLNISLNDVCFKPLEPDNLNCAITSPLEYFQGDSEKFNFVNTDPDFPDIVYADYLDHLMFCARSPLSVSGSTLNASYGCLGSSGMPVQPNLAFGGFNGTKYENATSVVITYIVLNDPNPQSEHVRKAELWEAEYLKRVRAWAQNHTDMATVSYQAERSVEDEINRQSEADVFTVLLSYMVMFLYVSVFLASYRSCRTLFVDLRITLGLGGVIIVIISVVASIGTWSYIGIPATLIIIEVIPFLVLAVGVDNIFILVHDFEFDEVDVNQKLRARAAHFVTDHGRCASSTSDGVDGEDNDRSLLSEFTPTIKALVETGISRTLGRVGPTLLLSSSAEAVAFFCGSLTTMPAVRVFALYAGVAIVFNFLLQLFAFVALLTLDARRRAANRFDVLCCFGLRDNHEYNPDRVASPPQPIHSTSEIDSLSLNPNALEEIRLPSQDATRQLNQNSKSVSWLHQAVAHFFTPFILSGWVRPVIVVLSLTWVCLSIAIIPHGLHIGLDQRLSMPDDSYVLDYFNALSTDLRVGPPVYFVVTDGHDYNTTAGQNKVCGTTGCPENSLMGQISDASKISSYTRIAQPASSWIDDYFDWIDPDGSPLCCRVFRDRTGFCPDDAPLEACMTCPVTLIDGRPSPEDFVTYLVRFLDQNPGVSCAKAGRAAYHYAVNLTSRGAVGATYFMTYHTVLSEPDDYLNALRGARRITDRINREWYANDSDYVPDRVLAADTVYAYSVFYVFYEQYLTVPKEAALQIGVCLAAITVVAFILLGLNFAATFMVVLGLLYIILSMLALMVLWKIDLNAISLVNLVVAVGIGVEFCAHIVRAFTVSVESTRLARAKAALTHMGSSILRGITLTKLGGIIVLAFSKSRLFQVFYFRMYLGIILFGAYTGLILLPVLLSYFGPGLNKALARQHMDRLREQPVPDIDAAEH